MTKEFTKKRSAKEEEEAQAREAVARIVEHLNAFASVVYARAKRAKDGAINMGARFLTLILQTCSKYPWLGVFLLILLMLSSLPILSFVLFALASTFTVVGGAIITVLFVEGFILLVGGGLLLGALGIALVISVWVFACLFTAFQVLRFILLIVGTPEEREQKKQEGKANSGKQDGLEKIAPPPLSREENEVPDAAL
ncbi:uncharacterized protein VTP21DRAFT_2803 [Calcarisporiella thermophila]|uniref:uncharacterized protein n=1 Tax=Calcarisporiella thermophila TaxID=911321 RepID=UPI003744A546